MTDHDDSSYPSTQNGSFKRPAPDRKKRRLYPDKGAKVHWTYMVEQVCVLYNVHSNTVINWMDNGLQAIDDEKPRLFRGSELNRFHTARREKARKTLRPGELYCPKCRGPRLPKPHTIRLEPSVVAFACVVACCSDCGTELYRMIGEAESSYWTARLTHNPPRTPDTNRYGVSEVLLCVRAILASVVATRILGGAQRFGVRA